jgi:signal transduction histidine kinase/ligand-binding sensor domain-containing protein
MTDGPPLPKASPGRGFPCALALVLGLLAGLEWTARAEPIQTLAGSEYLLRAWNTEDGLPENSATAIVQTGEGYLWFGTFRGLVRYNGDKFVVFDPANTPQLPHPGIVNLHADKRGRLWVSTYAGLVVKHGAQWRPFGTNEGRAGFHVRSFAERENGDLLITTFDGHVLAFENDRLIELPLPPGEPGRGYLGTVDDNGQWWLAQNRFVGYWDGQRWVEAYKPDPAVGRSAIACGVARGGGVWVLVAKELLKFRGGSQVSQHSFPQLRGGIWSLSEDSRTNLWICSYDSGLFQVTPAGELRHWTKTNGLGSLSTRVVFEDREENLWIGSSGGGLRRLTRQRFLELANPGSGKVVRSVALARNAGVWMALYDAGLFRQDAVGGTRISVPGPNNESAYGLSVLEDRAGRLWYGDQDYCWVRRGQDRFEKVPLKPSEGAGVRALFEDSKGRVWIGTRQGAVMYDGSGFQQLGPEAGLPRSEVDCFGEDQPGGLWVAGSEGVFHREKDRFTPVRDPDNQPLRGVLCFKTDADGTLWMGTRGAGLIRWRNGRMDRIGVEHGLPEREVRGIIEDEIGYFWLPSNRGILRASRKQLHAVADDGVARLEIQVLDQDDGLPSSECSTAQPNCARDAAGRLWFATQKGPAVIDPAGFRLNTQPPPVQVEQLSYYVPTAKSKAKQQRLSSAPREGEVCLTSPFLEPIQLPPGAYGLDIEFAVLSFSAPEKVRYQYQLEGHTRDWEDHTTDRLVRFPKLSHGEYVFRVRAANNDGVWNETGATLAFSVLPFFWQTGWFRLGTVLLLLALGGATVLGAAHRRIARALERERVAHEMRELREELAHSDRVSGLAQLASGLAHELGQPLGAILRNAEAAELLIEESPPDLAEIRAILTDIRQDDQRAAGVIQRMRTMLKRKPTDRIPLSLAELLPEVVALVRHNLLQRQAQLSVEVPPGLPAVRGDRIQLQQVLLNLLLNGMDSMNQQPPETRHLTIEARMCAGEVVEVSVRDSGPGVPAENVARVFEPFFSTKTEGMGIGLAVSKSIIEAHQGRIWMENRPEGGACFCFTVPVSAGTGKQ